MELRPLVCFAKLAKTGFFKLLIPKISSSLFCVPSLRTSEAINCDLKLKNYQGIPTRMQYWASEEQWGGTIRNAGMHAEVVHQMKQWVHWINSPVRTSRAILSFYDSESPSEENSSPMLPQKLEF
jgi:hypothetical protein